MDRFSEFHFFLPTNRCITVRGAWRDGAVAVVVCIVGILTLTVEQELGVMN